MWPQYSHRRLPGSFIRLDTNEAWVIQLFVASRKSVLRGYQPHTHGQKTKPCSRALVKSVCKELLHEFRQTLVEARKKHTDSRRMHDPDRSSKFLDTVAIRMHDCEVVASAHARQAMYDQHQRNEAQCAANLQAAWDGVQPQQKQRQIQFSKIN